MNFFKMFRINKITPTHFEMISDEMIVNNIINLSDAQKKLDRNQYEALVNKFKYYREKKTEYPTNSIIFENKAVFIAYMLENYSGAAYEDFCGDAIDILYVYGTKRDWVDSLFTEIYDDMKQLIQMFWENEHYPVKKSDSEVMAISIMFFRELFDEIIQRKNNYNMDYLFRSFLDEAILLLLGDYSGMFGGTPSSFNTVGEQIRKIRTIASRNTKSLDDFIDKYTNSFLSSINLSNNTECKEALIDFIDEVVSSAYEEE